VKRVETAEGKVFLCNVNIPAMASYFQESDQSHTLKYFRKVP